jgi:adenylate kinase
MRIILFGPPGVGKGSQAQFLSEREKVTHISTGILLRRAIESGTELGRQAQAFVESGELVLGVLVRSLAEDAVSACNFERYVLDGYPRTIEQAEWIDAFLAENEAPIDTVLSLKVPNSVIVDRLSKRRVHKVTGENFHLDFKPPPMDLDPSLIIQRTDDMPDAIQHRLEIYDEETHPVQAYYRERGLLREIDGNGAFEVVYSRILSAICLSVS